MTSFDLERIVSVLVEHEVRFVVIGAFGAQAHGSPFPTEDVDVTPERTHENLQRLSAALGALGARIRTDAVDGGLAFEHDAVRLDAGEVWNFTTAHGDLDVSFVPNGTGGFAQLDRDALEVELGGALIRVASLEDIIRSKQAANRLEDQRHLPVLREILAHRDTGRR